MGTVPFSRKGSKPCGREKGVSGCPPVLLLYPRCHPIWVDSEVDRSAQASESRTLAPSVEQEIYLKDTPVWPDRDQLAFLRAERVATGSVAPPDPALYQRHRSISIFSFCKQWCWDRAARMARHGPA